MQRLAIAVALMAVLGSDSWAQDAQKKRSPETRETEPKEQRRGQRQRRQYDQKKFAIKDPAGFKIEGEAVFSGPQIREKLPQFQAASLVGDNKGKQVDPVADAGKRPLVLFFQDDNGVALRGLFGVSDAISKIARKAEQDVHVACVFLTDDPDSITSRYGRVFGRLRAQGVDLIAVSPDGRNGPGALGLNRTVSQTIILAKDGKVTRNFVFRQGMLYADPHVMGGVAELVGEKRETVGTWLAEASAAEARGRGDDAQSAAKSAFRQKLGEYVKSGKITRSEAGELYRAAFPETEARERR